MCAASGACQGLDDGIDDTRCEDALDQPPLGIMPTSPARLTMGDVAVKLRGTASHDLGLAVRRITVAGLDATSDSFNYAAWSIDMPADLIVAKVPSNAMLPQSVSLEIIGYDACSDNAAAARSSLMIVVEEMP